MATIKTRKGHSHERAHVEKVPGAFWGVAALGGLLGALVMGLYMMASTWTLNMGAWVVPNMVAATLGPFRPPLADFMGGASLIGLAMHLAVGAVFGLVYGALAASLFSTTARRWGPAVLLGLGFGVFVWGVMVVGISPLLNPYLNLAPPYNFFYGHLFYGIVTALVVCAWERRRHVMVTFFPQEENAEAREAEVGGGRWI